MLKLYAACEEQASALYRDRMTRDFPPSELKSLGANIEVIEKEN